MKNGEFEFEFAEYVCLFVCLNPSIRPWAIQTYLFRGWQTWEDHAALPTNGLARESDNLRVSTAAISTPIYN